MLREVSLPAAVLIAGVVAAACAGSPEPVVSRSGEDPTAHSETPELVGEFSREEVEGAMPEWVVAEVEATPDREAAVSLASVPAGAEVVVYLGTWCSDSRRELGRFWRALDETGALPGFALRYIGVDGAMSEPVELVHGIDLRFVPTFIVYRDGREVGRVVEESPNGIERDLLALLTGDVEGVISARSDLAD